MRNLKRLIRKLLRLLLVLFSCLCLFCLPVFALDNDNTGYIFGTPYPIKYVNDNISTFVDTSSIGFSVFYKLNSEADFRQFTDNVTLNTSLKYDFAIYITPPEVITKDTPFNLNFVFDTKIKSVESNIVYFIRKSNFSWVDSFYTNLDTKIDSLGNVIMSNSNDNNLTAKNDINSIEIYLKNVQVSSSNIPFKLRNFEINSVSDSGLLSGIIGVLKSIWDTIKNLPSLIASALSSMFEWIVDSIIAMKDFLGNLLKNIINGLVSLGNLLVDALVTLGNFIIDGLKILFIPSDDFFKIYFNNLYNFFSEKLGFLITPFNIMADLINKFINIGEGSGQIIIPSFSLFGTEIIKATTFDLKGAFSYILGDFYSLYYAFIDCIILFGFVNFTKHKFDKIVGD